MVRSCTASLARTNRLGGRSCASMLLDTSTMTITSNPRRWASRVSKPTCGAAAARISAPSPASSSANLVRRRPVLAPAVNWPRRRGVWMSRDSRRPACASAQTKSPTSAGRASSPHSHQGEPNVSAENIGLKGQVSRRKVQPQGSRRQSVCESTAWQPRQPTAVATSHPNKSRYSRYLLTVTVVFSSRSIWA